MKKKIFFFGDSIIKYRNKNQIYDWSSLVKKKIKEIYKKKFFCVTKSIVGLDSSTALRALPNLIKKNKSNFIILVQLGINDSWHFKSLHGNANVYPKSFKQNLNKIYIKLKKLKFKKIIFIGYHKLEKLRFEINKKTLNQNLDEYINLIEKFCKKKKIIFIDMKHVSKYSKKKICLPIPDGVHLNNYGVQRYSEYIFKRLKNEFK